MPSAVVSEGKGECFPSRNRMNVGSDLTSRSAARSPLFCASIRATRTGMPSDVARLAARSTSGLNVRHAPHQGAVLQRGGVGV